MSQFVPSAGLSDDLKTLETWINNAWSAADKSKRDTAYNMIDQQIATNADVFYAGVCNVVPKCDHTHVRSLITVLLRKRLAKEDQEPPAIINLNQNTQKLIKSTLLQWGVAETDRAVRNQVIDCITEIGAKIAQYEPWNELIPWAFELYKSNKDDDKANALQILAYVCEQGFHQVEQQFQQVLDLYADALRNGSLTLQSAALQAIALTIHSLETDKCVIFENVVTDGLSCLEKCIQHDMKLYSDFKSKHPNLEPDWAEILHLSSAVIEQFQDIAEHEPNLFSKSLDKYVSALGMIIKNDQNPEVLRTQSLEVLIALAKADSAMCRKSKIFASAIVEILYESLLLEAESDEEWNEYMDDSNVNTMESHGQYALDQFLCNLDVTVLLPLILKKVDDSYWKSSYWTRRQCALNTVVQLSEYLDDEQLILNMVDRACGYVYDANARIRFTALSVFGQVASDHENVICNDIVGPKIMKAFIGVLDPQQPLKVQYISARALTNVVVRCDKAFLEPYLDDILQKLFGLLGASPSDDLTEQLLSAIAALALTSESLFVKYYDNFAPKLMNVMAHTEKESLRGQALECMSYIGNAVGAAKFEEDAAKLMPFTLQYYKNSDLTGDEKMFGTVMETWPRICAAIGVKFTQYLNEVMPIVLEAAKLDCQIQDLDSYKKQKIESLSRSSKNHNEIDAAVEENILEVWGRDMQEKTTYVNKSVVENKAIAIEVMTNLCETLKHTFWPAIPNIFPAIELACQDNINTTIRYHGIEIMKHLLQATIDSIAFKSGAKEEDLVAMTRKCLDILVYILAEGRDSGLINETCKAFDQIFACVPKQILSKALDNNEINVLKDILQKIFKAIESAQRYMATIVDAKKSQANWDEIDDYNIVEEKKLEEQMVQNLAQLISVLIKQYGDDFITQLLSKNADLMQTILRLLEAPQDQEATASVMHKLGVFIVCDIFENCSGNVCAQYVSEFVPRLGRILEIDANFTTQHPVYYSFGLMMQKCGNATLPYVKAMIGACMRCIETHSRDYISVSQVDHNDEDAAAAIAHVHNDLLGMVDNAVSCLYKFMKYINVDPNNDANNNREVDKNQLLDVWFRHLPIKIDCIEAVPNHEFLVQLVGQKNAVVMGVNGSNLPRIVDIFADIVDTELSTKELDATIGGFIGTIMQNNEAANAVRNHLAPFKQEKLKAFFEQK